MAPTPSPALPEVGVEVALDVSEVADAGVETPGGAGFMLNAGVEYELLELESSVIFKVYFW